MASLSPAEAKPTRVLVIGAGLGTNAGLGVEVPLGFGAFVTDGHGGVCEIRQEERSKRCVEGREHFKCFMGEEFSYKWDHPCEKDYKGNAGFLVGVLLKDPQLHVDLIQHPHNKADQAIVLESVLCSRTEVLEAKTQDEQARKDAIVGSLKAEKDDMWRQGFSDTHAQSIASLLHRISYDVVLVGSKGIGVCLKALERAPPERRISAVVINGAEYHLPEYTNRLEGAMLPGQESESFVGHALLHRVVLTSHGGLPGAGLRKCVSATSAKLRREGGPEQSVLMYTALDHRLVPNRESHSYPWSLIFPFDCWFPGRGKPSRLVHSAGHTVLPPERVDLPPLVSLVHWAAGSQLNDLKDGNMCLERIIQFPGPKRFAEIRIEVAHLASQHVSDEAIFQPIRLAPLRSLPQLLQLDAERYPHSGVPPWELSPPLNSTCEAKSEESLSEEFFVSDEIPVFDLLFDAQMDDVQIVFKDIRNGSKMPLRDILKDEGQYATRFVRFFRYYDDKSAEILAALQGTEETDTSGEAPPPVAKRMQFMLEELLAMNKNLGNFLWTGFMTPYTAYTPLKRFGTDLLELVIKIEVARVGGTYIGFSRSRPNAEHTILGQSAPFGSGLDTFLDSKILQLKAQRRREFMSKLDFENMSSQMHKFDRNEEIFFREHSRQAILGYERREFDIGGILPLSEAYEVLKRLPAQLGLSFAQEYHFSEFGHSTSFRIFPDGKAWLAASCEFQDFEHIQYLLTEAAAVENTLISLLTSHRQTRRNSAGQRSHWRIPAEIVPPGFFYRNGYEVFAYRKYGDAGRQFNGVSGAWEHFVGSKSQEVVEQFWFRSFGPAVRKTDTFGQFDKLPAEIGRGGTSAKLYCYDTEWTRRDDQIASVVLEGINVNVAAWWELQLYSMSPRNFEKVLERHGIQGEFAHTNCLTYSSEQERLQQMLRLHFEHDLVTARSLWAQGIKRDCVPESARAFPDLGSFANGCPELGESLGMFLRERILTQASILVPEAKAAMLKGVIDPAVKDAILKELLQKELKMPYTGDGDGDGAASPPRKTTLFKDEITQLMSMGLRGFQEIGRLHAEPVRKQALEVRRQFLESLQEHQDVASRGYLSRIAEAMKHDCVFTDLQEEVNVILDTLESCS